MHKERDPKRAVPFFTRRNEKSTFVDARTAVDPDGKNISSVLFDFAFFIYYNYSSQTPERGFFAYYDIFCGNTARR